MPPNGWCSPEKAYSLSACVMKYKPKLAVEIGVYSGRSFFAIALSMIQVGHGHLIGIDPWSPLESVKGWKDVNGEWWRKLDHNAIYAEFAAYRHKLGLDSITTTLDMTSDAAFEMFKRTKLHVDLLHVDGNHSPEQAVRDVENYVPMVNAGGIVYFDDLDWSETKPAQARLLELCEQLGEVNHCGIYIRH
jgi:predicted O-methyltransferase YrrM